MPIPSPPPHPSSPRILPASDQSFRVVFERGAGEQRRVHALTHALLGARVPWLRNVHPGFGTLLIVFDAMAIEAGECVRVLRAHTDTAHRSAGVPESERCVEIPVVYGGAFGPDLAEVARGARMSAEDFARAHAEPEYTVAFLGFAPGFPYLDGLPERLASPRLPAPRVRVPAGSVALGGAQTGIYPFDTPGGWRLIGRTPIRPFRPQRTQVALVEMGDRVRFRSIGRKEFEERARDEERETLVANWPVAAGAAGAGAANVATPTMRIERPGLLTTVQDAGRFGYGHWGVSASGAADGLALRIGNRMVGNPDAAAAVEMTLTGGTFVFEQPALIALTGAEFDAQLDGRPAAFWEVLRPRAGSRLEIGAARSGARCLLCVAGGIAVPEVLGSRSVHVVTGLGGRQLAAGDVLATGAPLGLPVAVERGWIDSLYAPAAAIRVTPAPHTPDFPDSAHAALCAGPWSVREQSNRMGVRLAGPALSGPRDPGALRTEGAAVGAVQVPPDGQPILLHVEHGTTGGYAKIANVCAVDLHRVGQLRPRDTVRFAPVDFAAAVQLAREGAAELAQRLPEVKP